uniref:Uncharacterized protein n=1 Tax=Plectus sambesii TaxID=2011161 RepID=A0A914XLE9_9BILA
MFTVNCKLRPNAEAVLALAHDVTSTISNGGELGNKSQDENQRESVSERSEEYSPKLPATEAKNSATSEEHSSDIKQTEDLSSQAEANEENATEITEDVPNTYYRTMLTRKNATTAGIVVAAGVATALAAPVVAGAAVGALGFGATGVAAGSWAATMMAWGGGTVPAAVAVLQSVGAAGIAGGTQVYAGLAASGVAARLLR